MSNLINLNFATLFNCGYWGELLDSISDNASVVESVIGYGLGNVQSDVSEYLLNNLEYNKKWEKEASDNCIEAVQDILDEDDYIENVEIISAKPFNGGWGGCGIQFTLNKEVDDEEVENFIYEKLKETNGYYIGNIVEAMQETMGYAYNEPTKQDMEKMYDTLDMKFSVPDNERPSNIKDFMENFEYRNDGIYHFKNEKQTDLFETTSSAKSKDEIVKSIIENAEGGILKGYSYCVMSEFWIGKCRYTINANRYTDEDYLDNKKWNQNKMKEYLKSNDFEDIKVKCTYGSNKGDTFTLAEVIDKEVNGCAKSFTYKGSKIIASSRKEAIHKIIAGDISVTKLTKDNIDQLFSRNKNETSNSSAYIEVDEIGKYNYKHYIGKKVNVKGDVNLYNLGLKKIPITFGKVGGDFDCYDNSITSLEGCPKEVGGSFDCSENNLTSLKGCPSKVGGYFNCQFNAISSLKGSPKEVKEYFDCSYNKLTSLKDCPSEVGDNFICSNNKNKFTEDEVKSLCKVGGEIYIK